MWGVPWLLNSIKEKIKDPFIYSDGNIVYNLDVLRKLKNSGITKPAMTDIVLSIKDVAPTHSRVILHKRKIHEINTRFKVFDRNNSDNVTGKKYYSL